MRKSAEFVLWPSYFDLNKTRNEGRKVGRSLAVERPTVEELAKALEMLGIPYNPDRSAAYPKSWWEKAGRVFVSKATSKSRLMVSVAKNLKKIRSKPNQ
jgi:signal recognition particle subunit SRP19